MATWLCVLAINQVSAQTASVIIDANSEKKAVSPFIYGRNNTFDQPISFYQDAGLRFSRMNGGNNATRYNWRKKITCHPDWYNNVYGADWDGHALNIDTNYPGMQGMFAFQLLGRVASNTAHNFDDWSFNQSQYWQGHGQNLAGGGFPTRPIREGRLWLKGILVSTHEAGQLTHPLPYSTIGLALMGLDWTRHSSYTGAWTMSVISGMGRTMILCPN